MDWKPIETAPKDGSEILTCNMRQGGIMRLIYWYRTAGQWREKGNVIVCLQDTHWMPLPKKPNAERQRPEGYAERSCSAFDGGLDNG